MTSTNYSSSIHLFPFKKITRLLCIGAAIVCSGNWVALPVQADVIEIDPANDPEINLSAKEARRLEKLLDSSDIWLESEFSPNDRYIVIWDYSSSSWSFLDTRRRRHTEFSISSADYRMLTEMRWKGSSGVFFIAFDASQKIVSIEVERSSGQATISPIALDGFPMSLSPDSKKVVVAEPIENSMTSRRMGENGGRPVVEVKDPGYGLGSDVAWQRKVNRRFDALVDVRLYVIDLESGKKETLVEVPENTWFGSLAWSPQSNRFAFATNEKIDSRRGGIVETDSPTVQDQLGNLSSFNNPFLNRSALELFRFRDRGVVRKTVKASEDGLFSQVTWGPFGLQFLARLVKPVELEGRDHTIFSRWNRSFFRLYTADGRPFYTIREECLGSVFGDAKYISPFRILFHATDGQTQSLFEYNVWTQNSRRIDTPDGWMYKVQITSDGDRAVFVHRSYLQPPEVFSLTFDSDRLRRVSRYNRSVKSVNRVQVHDLSFRLSNGEVRTGHLIQPRGAKFPPENDRIVVWQDGGPSVAMTNRWGGSVETPFNLLPNFGISVLSVPLPGRDGFSSDFMDRLADNSNFGVIDIDEQKEIVEQLIELGYTSSEKIGITGCSYGGYFATRSITRHPDLYAAANPQCSLLDLVDEYKNGWPGTIAYFLGASFESDPARYFEKSPSEFADDVKTPTLIFAGTEDFLPYQISEDFHDGIQDAGTPTDFYKFLGEGHWLFQLNSQIVAAQAQLLWFRKYLKSDDSRSVLSETD